MDDALKEKLSNLGVYIAAGLVVFTLVRLATSSLEISDWRATLLALGVMFIALEGFTRLGWLTKPVPGTEED